MQTRSGILARQRLNDIIKEFFRKSIHMCTAFVPLFLSFAKWPVIILLSIVLVVYIITENLRIRGKSVPLISVVTEAAARKRDENRFVLGPVTLASGVILTAIIFNQKSAAIGIYALALGDGLASLGGKLFGRHKIPFTGGKTFEGSFTCFAAVFVSILIASKSVTVAAVLAAAATAVELLPLKDFDNLLIPLLIASLAQFVFCIQ